MDAFSADRRGRLLEFFVSLTDKNGINFDQIILGSRAFDTIDPRNLEVILNTQFKGTISYNASLSKTSAFVQRYQSQSDFYRFFIVLSCS